MTKKTLKKYLLSNGFKDIGGDYTGQMYENEYGNVFLHRKSKRKDISFGHSSDGYYIIRNATVKHVKLVVSLFKSAIFEETSS